MSASEQVEAVVVGAGICGLACLWRLRRAGIDAIGLEAADRAGGVLRTEIRDGFLVETGPNTVMSSPPLSDLLRETGLEAEVVRAEPALDRFVYRRGTLHRLPHGAADLLRTRLISTRGKLRLLAEVVVSARHEIAEESVERFVARRCGREAVEAIAAPFVAGTFAGDPALLSAPSTLPSLVELERRWGGIVRGALRGGLGAGDSRGGVISLRHGFATLAERISLSLGSRLRLSQPARRVVANPDGSTLRVVLQNDTVVSARAVVLAVPARVAAGFVAELSPTASSTLAEIDAPPLAIVSLAWPRARVRHPLRGFGFLMARGDDERLLGCLWPSSIFPGRAPDGWVLLTSFVGGARHPDAIGSDDDELVERVRGELERILGATGSPRVLSVARYPRAIPQYTVGHAARVERVRRAVAAVPGLSLAGNFIDGISVGDCVRQGFEAASSVESHLKPE